MQSMVTFNHLGYYELTEKPSPQEIQEYYANKYYQQNKSLYSKQYSDEEITYTNNKIAQKYDILKQLLLPTHSKSMLDIGCGEGWTLSYFDSLNWNVMGIDYSAEGCKVHNPHMINKLIIGDVTNSIDSLIDASHKFDVLWLDNVLEHVLEPSSLLQKCKELMAPNGVLLIEVPNDFSNVQNYLETKQLVDRPYWIAVPDHISYFNRTGLTALCEVNDWVCKKVISDFPIDWNLFNNSTNYVIDSSIGPSCHQARMQIDMLMHQVSIEKTNKLYEALADLGMGRQIIGYFQLK